MTSPAQGWDDAYRQADRPPWDIGRPQPEFVALAEQGRLTGNLLDAGCGTGEHTLLAAEHGAAALGVDLSESAIEQARGKARERGLPVRFAVGDLLELPLPAASFDTVLDSGVFHAFDDPGRERYVAALARALRPGGFLHLLCFSDRQPGDWGPRRICREELTDAFADGWALERVEAATFDTNAMPHGDTVAAWLATVRRE